MGSMLFGGLGTSFGGGHHHHGGGGGAPSLLNQIVAQNTSGAAGFTARPFGVPTNYDWYVGRWSPEPVPPAGMTAYTGWGQVTPLDGAQAATVGSFEVRNQTSWMHLKTGGWVPMQTCGVVYDSAPFNDKWNVEGWDYTADFTGNGSQTISITQEPSTGGAVMNLPQPGDLIHWWLAPRGGFDPALYDYVFHMMDIRVTDPVDSGKFCSQIGADWWPDQGVGSGNAAVTHSNWVVLTDQFQTVGMFSCDPAAFRADVPALFGPTPEKMQIIAAGQSLMAYPFVRGSPRVALDFARDVRTLFGFSAAGTMTMYSSGAFCHDGSSQTAEDWTVRIDNLASGGSALIDTSQGGSQIASGNYWWNTQDNSAATGSFMDVANAPGPLWRALMTAISTRTAAGASPRAFIWSQGTTDMTSDPTMLALYESTEDALFDAVRAAAGNPNLPIFINRIGRHQTANDAGAEGIRQAQRNTAAAKTKVYFSAEEYPHRYATAGLKTGAGLTSGSNVVTLADTSGLSVNDGIAHANLPIGSYISSISTNVSITLSYLVNGIVTPANATATLSGQTIQQLDNVHLYPGSDGVQPLDTAGNTKHNETDGFYAVFKAAARRIAHVYGVSGITASQGPALTGAAPYTGATVLRAAFTHVAGTDLVVPNAVAGWAVWLDGVAQNVIGASRADATHVDLLLGAPLFGSSVKTQYAYGAMNHKGYDGFIFDNASPVAFPAQAVDPITRSVVTPSPGAGPATATLSGHAENASTLSTYTFTGAIPAAGRYIIGIGTRKSAGTPVINSVTAAGAIARPLKSVASASGNINLTALYVVDATAAGDVVVSLAAASLRCGIGVWSITGYNVLQSVVLAPASSTANPASASFTGVPAGSAIIGYLFGGSSTLPTTTWSGATEDFDLVVSSTLMHSGAHANNLAAGNLTVSATLTANNQGSGAVFAVIGP